MVSGDGAGKPGGDIVLGGEVGAVLGAAVDGSTEDAGGSEAAAGWGVVACAWACGAASARTHESAVLAALVMLALRSVSTLAADALVAEVAAAGDAVRIDRARRTSTIAPITVVVTPDGRVIASVAPTIARRRASATMTMIAPMRPAAGKSTA